MTALIIAAHAHGQLDTNTARLVSAARLLTHEVHILVLGSDPAGLAAQAASIAGVRPAFIRRLVARLDAAGNATSLAAWARANGINSSSGKTLATSPIASASGARKASPSNSFSAARG